MFRPAISRTFRKSPNDGALGRNRTGTILRSRDFKSFALCLNVLNMKGNSASNFDMRENLREAIL